MAEVQDSSNVLVPVADGEAGRINGYWSQVLNSSIWELSWDYFCIFGFKAVESRDVTSSSLLQSVQGKVEHCQ